MITRESAQAFALKALQWLVGNEDLLPVFLGASGASADDLRHGVNDPQFLGSVIDFLLMDDAWITELCDALSMEYSLPFQYRQALPGGEVVNWT